MKLYIPEIGDQFVLSKEALTAEGCETDVEVTKKEIKYNLGLMEKLFTQK